MWIFEKNKHIDGKWCSLPAEASPVFVFELWRAWSESSREILVKKHTQSWMENLFQNSGCVVQYTNLYLQHGNRVGGSSNFERNYMHSNYVVVGPPSVWRALQFSYFLRLLPITYIGRGRTPMTSLHPENRGWSSRSRV